MRYPLFLMIILLPAKLSIDKRVSKTTTDEPVNNTQTLFVSTRPRQGEVRVIYAQNSKHERHNYVSRASPVARTLLWKEWTVKKGIENEAVKRADEEDGGG